MLSALPARAHAAEQGFVLLLPTDFYITTGITVVALTAIAIAALPASFSGRAFATARIPGPRMSHLPPIVSSLLTSILLAALIVVGMTGSGDPLSNPLPLTVWTIWWALFLFLQGMLGDIWKWLNPWTGLYSILFASGDRRLIPLPAQFGSAIGILALLAFSAFALADPAPDYPPRLAAFTAGYWLFTFAGMVVFGERDWLARCECFTILFRLFATVTSARFDSPHIRIGLPGWQIATGPALTGTAAVFVLAALAIGSFDGLNETFWWLSVIGINPLEFPGRSSVIAETLAGIALSTALLIAVFALCVRAGNELARLSPDTNNGPGFMTAFRRLAPSVLPITLGYHFAHYLTSFMVNGQYALAAVNDPFSTGADLFGVGEFYVTTGFFNTRHTVRVILLTQCVAIVAGHVFAVLAAHRIAVDLYRTPRRAALSQIPMAIFMVCYTLLSLWLLASPRGA